MNTIATGREPHTAYCSASLEIPPRVLRGRRTLAIIGDFRHRVKTLHLAADVGAVALVKIHQPRHIRIL